jgi:hypothetical protein
VGFDLNAFFSENTTYCDELITEYNQRISRTSQQIETDRDKVEQCPHNSRSIEQDECMKVLLRLSKECENITNKMDAAAEQGWTEKMNVVRVNPGAVDGVKQNLMATTSDMGFIAVQLKDLMVMCMVETDGSLNKMEKLYADYAYSFHGLSEAFIELLSVKPLNEDLKEKLLTSVWAYKYFHERAYYDSKVSFLFLNNEDNVAYTKLVEELALNQAHKAF